MNKIFITSLLFPFFAALSQTYYLPANAVDKTIITPQSGNPIFAVVEQKGRMPYKGHTCDDESPKEQGTDGKSYDNNQYARVLVNIIAYKEQGKSMYEQMMKTSSPEMELKSWEQNQKSETSTDFKRSLTGKNFSNGRMVLSNDHHTDCTEGKYKTYEYTAFSAYASIGMTIVKIRGEYFSADAGLAEKYYNEIVDVVKKQGLK